MRALFLQQRRGNLLPLVMFQSNPEEKEGESKGAPDSSCPGVLLCKWGKSFKEYL